MDLLSYDKSNVFSKLMVKLYCSLPQDGGSLVVDNGGPEHTVQGELDPPRRPGGAAVPGEHHPEAEPPTYSRFGMLIGRFLGVLQDTLLRAVRQSKVYPPGGIQLNAPTHKWTYASAFLYSLTLITTIGE